MLDRRDVIFGFVGLSPAACGSPRAATPAPIAEGAFKAPRFSPDGRLLAASSGRQVRVWDGVSGKSVGPDADAQDNVWDAKDTVWSIAWLSGTTFAGVCADGHVRCWRAGESRAYADWPVFTEYATEVIATHDGARIFVSGSEDAYRVLDAGTGREVRRAPLLIDNRPLEVDEPPQLHGHLIKATSFALSRDGRLLASGDDRGIVVISDAQTGTFRTLIERAYGYPAFVPSRMAPTTDLDFSPDGKTLIGGSGDDLEVWDVATGKVVTKRGFNEIVDRVAFAPNGKKVAAGDYDGDLELLEVSTGSRLRPLWKAHLKSLAGIAFHPSGRLIAATASGGLFLLRTDDGAAVTRAS